MKPPAKRKTINMKSVASQPATCSLQPATRFALRKGLGVWELTFESKQALLKHEQGIFYVAYLLINPPKKPIHGMALAAEVTAAYGDCPVATEIMDPATGKSVVVGKHAEIVERSLALDDAEAAAALRRKQRELEAILDDESQIEPVKAEALRDLQAIYAYQKARPTRILNTVQKAVRNVRVAFQRFHQRLVKEVEAQGGSGTVLSPFADHLRDYLIIPSARYSGRDAARAREGLAGCFTYEPPAGVKWVG